MTVLLENLWSSTKQIKAPYVFDWELGIALHTMLQNWASSHGEGKFSFFFLKLQQEPGYILELWWG